MGELSIIVIGGLVYLATRITKILVERRLSKSNATMAQIIKAVNTYSGAKAKLANEDIKKVITRQIKYEAPKLKPIIEAAIEKVEKPKKSTKLKVISKVVFKLIDILL